MADSIKVSIDILDAAAQKSLSDFATRAGVVDKGFKKLGDTGKGTFNEISVGIGKSIGVFDIFAGNLAANVVVGAFNAMAGAAGSLFNVLVTEGIAAAQESEDALNSLNVALAQSGLLTDGASDRFTAFAKTIQQTTAFEDDLVIKNIALLASLTSLDEEGLKGATTAATNLSAALGKDLATTTEALAKAANGNTATIKKMGIQFEESGTKAGTFQNILAAIEDKVGGTATSKINTYSGALAQNRNAFGDLQEEIGGLITQNPAVISAINAITSVLTGSSGSVSDGKQAYKELVAEGLILFIDTATATAIAVNTLVQAFNIGFNAIKVGVLNTFAAIALPLSLFSDTAKEALSSFREDADKALSVVADLGGPGPLDETIVKLSGIGNAARDGFDKLKAGLDSTTPSLSNATNETVKLTEAQIQANEETNKYVTALAGQNESVKSVYESRLAELSAFYDASAVVEEEKGLINYEAQLQREVQFYDDKSALLLEKLNQEKALIDSSSVDPSIKIQAKLAAEQKYTTDSLKLSSDFSKKSVEIDKLTAKQKEQNQRDTFSTIATLSSSNNKGLAAIGKAAGVAQIAIDTPVAISKALASAPPPFNFALAGLVGTAMAAQAAKIAGINFASGGIVPGTSFTGDRVQANLNSKEMVLNTSQQAQLFELANGRGNSEGSGITREEVAAMVSEVVNRPVVINIDGREVFNVIRDGQNSGRRF